MTPLRSRIVRAIGEVTAAVRGNRFVFWGLATIVVLGAATVVHPILMGWVWPTGVYDPLTGFDSQVFHPSAPSGTHWLGTDAVGRDVLSMLLAGLRPTWLLALSSAITTALVSTLVAALGAYHRGWIESALGRVSDAFLLLPAPIVMVVIGSGEFSSRLGPIRFGLIYGILAGMGAGAIVLRSHALQVMAMPFMEAARTSGASSWHLITRHLLPHLYPFAALFMMLAVVGAVVSEGFASFFGQTASRLTWGTIVYLGITFRAPLDGSIAWNAVVSPAVAISLFSAAFYSVSIGLRAVSDPRVRQARRPQPPAVVGVSGTADVPEARLRT